MNGTREQKLAFITRLEVLIERMQKMKQSIVDDLAQPQVHIGAKCVIPRGTWVIKQRENKYYQYISTNRINGEVTLVRHNEVTHADKFDFETLFVRATDSDVERHLRYLASKNITYINIVDIVDNNNKGNEDTINIITEWAKEVGSNIRNEGKSDDTKKITLVDFAKKYREETQLQLPKPNAFDVTKCDFYMLSIDGDNGSKKRHPSYQQAENEAVRLCGLTEKEVFIIGVVASVKPVKTTKTIVTITPQVNKR